MRRIVWVYEAITLSTLGTFAGCIKKSTTTGCSGTNAIGKGKDKEMFIKSEKFPAEVNGFFSEIRFCN